MSTVKRTFGGKAAPAGQDHLYPASISDQAIAERNAKPNRREGAARVTAGPFDKALQKRAEQPWESPDPFMEAIDSVREPGFAYKPLSDRTVQRKGMRGYVPCKDEKGDPLKVAGMTIGKMPLEMKQRRNEHFREIGNNNLKEAHEDYMVQQERIISDGGARGFAPLATGDVVTDRSDPERSASIGLHRSRG